MVLTAGQGYIGKMTSRNKPGYTHGDNKAFSEIMTATPSQYAKWGKYPWYEEDGVTYNGAPLKEAGVDVITKASLGHLVRGLVGIPGVFDPLGMIGNFQEFGTSDSSLILEGYSGLISPMRELILLMRFYKYLLDNNIDQNVYSAVKDVKFDYDMYGQEVPPTPDPTIADFAKEFAKVAETWEKTTGNVTYTYDGKEYKHENVNYVPDYFTITLNGTNYNKLQMHEIALNALKALEGGAALTDPITKPGSYDAPSAPYHEYDSPLQEKEAGIDLLDNFATRCLNYLKNNGEWPNVCGYPRTSDPVLTTYNGYVCVERNLLMLSRLCKYMVDNNVTSVAALASVKVSTELWGEGAPTGPTLKDFAQEFVKGLDVWAATVGTVESESEHLMEKGAAWTNVHFIPIVPNPNCEYLSHAGNQYDPKYTPWVLNVGGQEISSSQAWEIAIRGLMNMVTKEGEDFLPTMDTRNKAYTLGNNKGLSTSAMPTPSADNKWGKHPWYEGANSDRVKYNGAEIESVDVNFMVKVGAWHVVRSFIQTPGNKTPLGMIGNFQEFGTGSGSLNLDGYAGLIAPMRELVVLMRIYKYLLDNNIDSNVYDAIKDKKFDFWLYNVNGDVGDPTIKDFATEYVKILDIWEKTTGEVVMHPDVPEETVANAHYVPATTTITVGGKTYNTADMWETALRSYLLVRGYNGLETEKYGKNSIPALEGGALAMSTTPVPPTHGYYWGSAPFNETKGNGGHLVLGTESQNEHCKVKVDILDNWAMRSLNFQHGQSITNLCGYSGGQLDGYYGCFCSQRALLTYAFFFKYMLDNNLDKGTEVAADVIIRSELLGNE